MNAKLVFWISAGLFLYTYLGYYLILRILTLLIPRRDSASKDVCRQATRSIPISVIVTVHNEERVIQRRIENLLDLEYARDKLEIIVASDGSTDRTNEIARRYEPQGVILLELSRIGKGPAQNLALVRARGEIIVVTDAETEFERNFLNVAVRYFLESSQVGALAANLRWRLSATPAAQFRGLSWKMETDLREMESRLGILASASGAAMAFRRALWKPMRDSLDDSDSVTPLDVIGAGAKVVFAGDAVAYEVPFPSMMNDFRSKVRGVSKTVIMILRRWRLRDWVSHPLILWRTLSHHFLRWVSPYVILIGVVCSLLLLNEGIVYRMIAVGEGLFALLFLIGFSAERLGKRVAVASQVTAFAVVNAGFAVGVLKAIVGAAQGPFETE